MQRFEVSIETEGPDYAVNLAPLLAPHLRAIRGSGVLMLFVQGSTASLASIDDESGLVKRDLPLMLQRLVPDDIPYQHEATWNDDNGHSHLRATLLGASISVPCADGKLLTGDFQHIVLIEHDTRPRKRTVIVSVVV